MSRIPGASLLFMVRTGWHYAGAGRRSILLFYAMFLAANITLSFQPMVLAKLLNTAQQGGDGALKNTLLYSLLYGSLTVVFWSFHGPARLIERHTAFNLTRDFVAMLYRKVTEMPLRWHQDHHTGSTINRIRKAERALMAFSETQFVPIEIIVRLVTSTVLLAFYSLPVAGASIAVSFLIMVVIRRFDRVLVPMVEKTNEAEHHLNAALYDYIGNIMTVLTLRMNGTTQNEIQQRYEGIKGIFRRQASVNEWKWGTIQILLIASQMIIVALYIASHMHAGTMLAVGSVVAVYQYLSTIMNQFFSAGATFGGMLQQSIDVHGVDNLLDDHARLNLTPPAPVTTPWREIKVRDLAFTHHEGQGVLHHLRGIDLDLTAGRKIAFIGSSGSGKTTLLTVLRGLYEARQVELAIDGQPFDSLRPLAQFATLIPQDAEIFENSVLYNLTLGTHLPQQVIDDALAMSAFDEVLPKLPNGIETDIRERGVNMSGGQKQRLALARGLIAAHGSALLLLDEPTSSIDTQTEARIFDRIFKTYADKTIIASVHRLHLLPRFDHIVLMQNGEIMEQGSFVDLLSRPGPFAKVWQAHLAQVEQGAS